MSSKNPGADADNRGKEKRSQRRLRPNLSSKYTMRDSLRKSLKKQKSQKKSIQNHLSKKQQELRSNYYDKDAQHKIKNSKDDYYHEKISQNKRKKHVQNHKFNGKLHHSRNCSEEIDIYKTMKGSHEIKKVESSHDINKLKIFESKGFITFDGKLVKVPPRIHNYPCTSSFVNYTDNEYLESVRKSKKKRKRDRSYHKAPQRMIKSKTKSKSKSKSQKKNVNSTNKKRLKKSIGIKFQNSALAKRCKQEEVMDTEPTPHINIFSQKKQTINIEEVKKEIEEETKKDMRINLEAIDKVERIKCIKMISKICGLLNFRKQTFALAVLIFDKYLHSLAVSIPQIKKISLISLILAVKHEEGNRSHQFIYQLITSNSLSQKRQTKRSVSGKNKQKDKKSKSKQKMQKEERKKKEDSVQRKTQILSMILIDRFGELERFKKSELGDLQNTIFTKLGYRFRYKTYAQWVDSFTIIWDQHIITNYNNGSHEKLLFRCPKSIINFSLLLQILEASYFNPKVYTYSQIVLVLSVMYLLIRILMEGEMIEGFLTYKKMLKKSSNSLFVDRVGSNKIFGQFLQSLSLQMGEILLCCQYVSNYLLGSLLEEGKVNYQTVLSVHSHNPQLYANLQN